MKLAALLYFVLLAWAHQVCGLDRSLLQPLCDFREGEHRSLGYALFAAIGLIGAFYAIDLRRRGGAGEAANATGSALLLLLIAATPSDWIWHRAAAMALLSSIFVHYLLVLSEGPRALLVLHASAPLVLAIGTGFQSYGLWQKAMICYLVVVAVVHHHVVMRRRHHVGDRMEDALENTKPTGCPTASYRPISNPVLAGTQPAGQ